MLYALWALAASAGRAAEEEVTLNFVNADIESVVKTVGMISGKNFLLDPRVKGTINIVSSGPVPKDLTYQILLSALRLQGFAALEARGIVKIVPEADAKQSFSATTTQSVAAVGDQIITHVHPLRYESAAQLLPILRPLIAPNNTIAAYANTNTLVITDYADNVRRLNKIIDAIDQPNRGEVLTLRLQHASCVDLAQTLNRLMAEGAAPAEAGRKLVVAADARTNSLLIRADNPALIARIGSLAASLDVPTGAAGNIHVVYLRNAEAVKLAQTLRAILAGDASLASAAASTPMGAAVPVAASAPAAPAAGSGTAPAPLPAGGIVQADAATNSLIITAPDNVYNTVRAVIDRLDARRAQVYVEALIAEVTTDKAAEFGIQWQSLEGINKSDSRLIGGANLSARGAGTNILDAATNISTVGRGLNIGIVKGQINLPGVGTISNLGLLARALESDVNANILSTPNLLTLDNEEAKIVIGQNVPFITGQFALTGSAVTPTPFQTIERKDVGLTLKVRPQISEGGTVKLQIYQEVSSLSPVTNAAGLITNKRSIESTVLVDDGRIVVLGGLIQDDVQDADDKVPVLGDVPVLGHLFRYASRRRVKTNLMVFLRPTVLKDADASSAITGDRYGYIRDEQGVERLKDHFLLPDMPMPRLPPATFAPPAKP